MGAATPSCTVMCCLSHLLAWACSAKPQKPLPPLFQALASMAVLPNLNQLELISFDEEVNTPTGGREVAQGLEALAAAGASKAVHVEFLLALTFFSYHQVRKGRMRALCLCVCNFECLRALSYARPAQILLHLNLLPVLKLNSRWWGQAEGCEGPLPTWHAHGRPRRRSCTQMGRRAMWFLTGGLIRHRGGMEHGAGRSGFCFEPVCSP